MNLTLKDIVKEELQKLLDAGFVYPISNNAFGVSSQEKW